MPIWSSRSLIYLIHLNLSVNKDVGPVERNREISEWKGERRKQNNFTGASSAKGGTMIHTAGEGYIA